MRTWREWPAVLPNKVVSEIDRVWFRRRVLRWFRQHGRRYPWRETDDAYRILIAELLLQRTRTDVVERIYPGFVAAYPTPESLAAADPRDVEALLRPLGFVHRTRRLPELARVLLERHAGRVPTTEGELSALPGVGRYVANAVLAVAFRRRRPLLDPNVIRLLDRALGVSSVRARPRDDSALWDALADLAPTRNAREFALGLVDLGAIVCVRRPRCYQCPLRPRCVAFQSDRIIPADG
jgi:A/G-specific adenine glycosylase